MLYPPLTHLSDLVPSRGSVEQAEPLALAARMVQAHPAGVCLAHRAVPKARTALWVLPAAARGRRAGGSGNTSRQLPQLQLRE